MDKNHINSKTNNYNIVITTGDDRALLLFKRVIAAIVDRFIMGILFSICLAPLFIFYIYTFLNFINHSTINTNDFQTMIVLIVLLSIVAIVLSILYLLQLSTRGGTLGMRLLSIKATDLRGRNISKTKALFFFIIYAILLCISFSFILLIDFILMLTIGRCIHDLLLGVKFVEHRYNI